MRIAKNRKVTKFSRKNCEKKQVVKLCTSFENKAPPPLLYMTLFLCNLGNVFVANVILSLCMYYNCISTTR